MKNHLSEQKYFQRYEEIAITVILSFQRLNVLLEKLQRIHGPLDLYQLCEWMGQIAAPFVECHKLEKLQGICEPLCITKLCDLMKKVIKPSIECLEEQPFSDALFELDLPMELIEQIPVAETPLETILQPGMVRGIIRQPSDDRIILFCGHVPNEQKLISIGYFGSNIWLQHREGTHEFIGLYSIHSQHLIKGVLWGDLHTGVENPTWLDIHITPL